MQNSRKSSGHRTRVGRQLLIGTTTLAGLIAQAYAQDAVPKSDLGQVVVRGYQASLESSTKDKREAVGFQDSIFAEDMGKFPDSNIAESLARIPGVTVNREITGEGQSIAIRGLGSSFTRVLMNGAPVASASTGRTDNNSANREVDLDFLPTDLFTKVTVSKSPTASMIEGGAAGVVDMRVARPFDRKGEHFAASLQAVKAGEADKVGNRGSVMGSKTFGDSFGVLAGLSWANNNSRVTGFETIGWTNAGLTTAQNTAAKINTTGGGNWTIPNTVPANAGSGLVTGATIDQAFLLANNPGASITQIDNGLIPRLGRASDSSGTRNRINGVLSLEFRPSNDLKFYADTVLGKKENNFQRIDMNWVGRFGAMVPTNMQFDRADCTDGCVVTKGTFTNAQYFLEFRPYVETTEFAGFNPGMEWKISDKLVLDGQVNFTKSNFHREAPTVLFQTLGGSGITVNYDNTSGGIPSYGANVNLNDPSKFGWNGGRLNVQDEEREVITKGIKANLKWGDKAFNVKTGLAIDDVSRRITSYNNDAAWQNLACGNNLNVQFGSGSLSQNALNPGGCNGAVAPGAVAASVYPGYGTGSTQGATLVPAYLGSLIPNANVPNYLIPGPLGFVTVDWNKFRAASGYDQVHQTLMPTAGNTNTGTTPGYISERTTAIYGEVNGVTSWVGNTLNYNAGLRYVRTQPTIGTISSVADPRNAALNLAAGGKYPNILTETQGSGEYANLLPSASASVNLSKDWVLRGSMSKTMTRADPSNLRPLSLSFSSPSADQGTLTNPSLKPYESKNLDLGLEWYTGKEGYVGATVFNKKIAGFTANVNTVVPFSDLAQYGVTYDSLTTQQKAALDGRADKSVILTQVQNAGSDLTVDGLELNWVQPLNGILPVRGFGFSANYTKIMQTKSGDGSFIAVGVPDATYNLSAYYEHKGVMLRLSQVFSKGSQSTNSPQNGLTAANLFSDDYRQLDFSSRLDIGQWLNTKSDVSLSFDIQNLTKEIQRSYFQFSNATFTQYDPGRTYVFGLRISY